MHVALDGLDLFHESELVTQRLQVRTCSSHTVTEITECPYYLFKGLQKMIIIFIKIGVIHF